MTKKIILTTVALSAFSFLLSACTTTDKLRVDVQHGSDMSVTSALETISASPSSDPSTLSDEQLLLQMESDSDASIDQEFNRLDSELK